VARAELIIRCPQCGSEKTWRDGIRYSGFGQVQRYVCRRCGYRFSDPEALREIQAKVQGIYRGGKVSAESKSSGMSEHVQRILTKPLKSVLDIPSTRQICVTKAKGAKNLAAAENQTQAAGIAPQQAADIKGKVVAFAWWMEKQGYAKESIRGALGCLRALQARDGNLFDPESIKEALAREKNWSQNRRRNVINAYSLFLKVNGMQWEKPKCQVTQKFPFIPTEQEIDALIDGSGKKTATFLQLLKETAMRSGEAKRLQWTDIDFEKNIITLNSPEKGSNPRMWKVSAKLTAMLNNLSRESQRVFGDGPINSMKTTFLKARKRLANKLQNPRLLRTSFHTFRHWRATMLYHQTKDPYYVQHFLGHKSIRNTEIYINIEHTMFEPTSDEFTVKVASKTDEVKALLEVGFEYVCQKDGLIFLRKRK